MAGPFADIKAVQVVQSAVVAAGHDLTLDWSRGPDAALDDYGSLPEVSAELATEDLEAVLTADAVLVVASDHDGRGMFVELGAALARAQRGELEIDRTDKQIGSVPHADRLTEIDFQVRDSNWQRLGGR